ncbi:Zn-dependent hydrolase [Sporomusa aerivorans]|uniref:Zn-dependent hydrolase n=1 Tax=Sporomusa aerivorans TaxID=204936 RepID=UPI00352AF674
MQFHHSRDLAWILAQIEQLAQFGQNKSGVTRLAFSPPDHQARQHVITIMQDMGLTVHTDAIGNIIGRFTPNGISADTPAVVTGSHLDTVPAGGKYDGVLGVVCSLAALRRLKTYEELRHPIEVVVFAAEESSRFEIAAIGSKAMAGLVKTAVWKRLKDADGIALADELQTLGLQTEHIETAARPANSIKCFVELHIEQGRVLEQGRVDIGIVDRISALTRLKITVAGTPGHAGGAAIEDRQDALVSAAMIVLAVRNIAVEYEYQGAVATVTILKTHPGVSNVIPGQVEMWVDIRGNEQEYIVEILQEIKDAVSSIADEYDTPVAIAVLSSEKPINLDDTLNQTIEAICTKLKLTSLRLDSRTGHDTMSLAHIAPSALVVVPCQDGISHNSSEYVAPENIAAGLEVLTETLYFLAK